MAANVLSGRQAIKISVFVVRAFVKSQKRATVLETGYTTSVGSPKRAVFNGV